MWHLMYAHYVVLFIVAEAALWQLAELRLGALFAFRMAQLGLHTKTFKVKVMPV